MAFLDNFNKWYASAVPDTEPCVAWNEPIGGSRYRTRQNRREHVVIIATSFIGGVGIFLLFHGTELSFSRSVFVFGSVGALYALAYWVHRYIPTTVTLTDKFVSRAHGRSVKIFRFGPSLAVRFESAQHGRALVFSNAPGEEFLVFLAPDRESEVLEFLKKHKLPDPLQTESRN